MENLSPKEPFELTIPVRPEDIDVHNHVNNIVYVRWIQDVALAHWNAFASQELKDALTWVVTRHEIDYRRSARLGDTAVARTWVGKAGRNIFERHTEILRQSDMKLMIRARSLWCPVDTKTLKPVRVGPDLYEQWSRNENDN